MTPSSTNRCLLKLALALFGLCASVPAAHANRRASSSTPPGNYAGSERRGLPRLAPRQPRDTQNRIYGGITISSEQAGEQVRVTFKLGSPGFSAEAHSRGSQTGSVGAASALALEASAEAPVGDVPARRTAFLGLVQQLARALAAQKASACAAAKGSERAPYVTNVANTAVPPIMVRLSRAMEDNVGLERDPFSGTDFSVVAIFQRAGLSW